MSLSILLAIHSFPHVKEAAGPKSDASGISACHIPVYPEALLESNYEQIKGRFLSFQIRSQSTDPGQ